MADISKILTEAWLKVNEGIGSAANSIADATKEKVNEIIRIVDKNNEE